MPRDVVVLFARPEGQRLIARHCRKAQLRVPDLKQLVTLEAQQVGRDRKGSLWTAFDEILDGMDEDLEARS